MCINLFNSDVVPTVPRLYAGQRAMKLPRKRNAVRRMYKIQKTMKASIQIPRTAIRVRAPAARRWDEMASPPQSSCGIFPKLLQLAGRYTLLVC